MAVAVGLRWNSSRFCGCRLGSLCGRLPGWFAAHARQILQNMPVFQPILLGHQQSRAGVARFVEMLAKTAFATGEVNEIDSLTGLRVRVPVLILCGISLQAQPLLDRVALPGVIDEKWK